MAEKNKILPIWQQVGTLLLNLGFGLLPSLLFFVWMERNCSLPYAISPGVKLHVWRFVDLGGQSLWVLGAFDLMLFFAFGFLHSLFAQRAIHDRLMAWLPPQAIRTFYMIVTGISALAVMAFWQSTGVVLWAAPLPPNLTLIISMVIFWSCFLGGFAIFAQFGLLRFIGLDQIFESQDELSRLAGNPVMIETGLYAWMRHPVYFLGALGLILTPVMTLDRVILIGAIGIYLFFAIPIEEKKLVAIFGNQYENYRMRVSAVIPWRPKS